MMPGKVVNIDDRATGSGGNMKVTPLIASRWVKAAFLAVLGVVLLLYTDKFVSDLRAASEDSLDISFVWTWDLLRVLMWVLVAWLFVDAVLTIALSFSEHRYSLADVMRRIQRIEAKLGIPPEEAGESLQGESEHTAQLRQEESAAPVEESPAPPPPRD